MRLAAPVKFAAHFTSSISAIFPIMRLAQSIDTLTLKVESKETLQRNSKGPGVRALQILLYSLGFSKELNWDKYRADGGFGGSTTAAVKAFLQKNDLPGDGISVDARLLALMLRKEAILPALRALKQHLVADTLSELSTDHVKSLMAALELTFDPAAPVSSWKALASKLGVAHDGNILLEPLASAWLQELAAGYGDEWETAGQDTGATQRVASEHQIEGRSNGFKVSDKWVSANFVKAKAGVYYFGEALPADFIRQHRQLLLRNGLSESVVRVMLPVSANEGNLDAVNTWDDCFMTFGMFQWTLGQKDFAGELGGLLARIKEESPESFTEYFGRYGLEVIEGTKTTGYVSMNGTKVGTVAQKEAFRDLGWAFRFWRAGLDPRIQVVQIKHAADRILSFWDHPHYLPADRFRVRELITSEYGMCLILDHSVNRPGHLMKLSIGRMDILGKALQQSGLADTDPATWTTAEEMKLIDAYLPLRAASSMTHAADRAKRILAAADRGELSKERHSFQLSTDSASRSRSLLIPIEPEVLYPLVDPEEYELRVPMTQHDVIYKPRKSGKKDKNAKPSKKAKAKAKLKKEEKKAERKKIKQKKGKSLKKK